MDAIAAATDRLMFPVNSARIASKETLAERRARSLGEIDAMLAGLEDVVCAATVKASSWSYFPSPRLETADVAAE